MVDPICLQQFKRETGGGRERGGRERGRERERGNYLLMHVASATSTCSVSHLAASVF